MRHELQREAERRAALRRDAIKLRITLGLALIVGIVILVLIRSV